MKIAVCGLGCKSTFEVTEENESGAICHVLTIDPEEDDGYREVMTFGCDVCQKSAAERKDILETSAVAVTAGEERDRYRGELAEAEVKLDTEREVHDETKELLTAQENMLAQEEEAHAVTSGQLDEARAELDQKEHEE